MNAKHVDDLSVIKAQCDWIIDHAKELKALVSYQPSIIFRNQTRAFSAIETMRCSLNEIELYIKEHCTDVQIKLGTVDEPYEHGYCECCLNNSHGTCSCYADEPCDNIKFCDDFRNYN